MESSVIRTEFAPLDLGRTAAEGEGGAKSGADRALRLVEAAYHLLDDHGLEGLTIRAVLAETGLARRAFYENFSGKDDLVLAVFATTIAAAAQHYRGLGEAIAEPLDRVRMIVTSIALGSANILDEAADRHEVRRSAALSREHMRLAESRPADLQLALAPLLELIAEELRAAIAAGQVRECDPALTATLMYNLLSTTVHTRLLMEEATTPDPQARLRLAGEIWDFCRRAIIA